PRKSLREVPAGTYWIQALLHKYETFKRSDGHTVKLPMDRGEGQHWNLAPGNIYSKPQQIKIDPGKAETISISLDQEIPPIQPPKDTRYIKHIKIQSEKLTKFWGRPMYLGACVLLPHGFDEHPEARYPLMVFHGHFPNTFGGFRESPPDPNLKPDYSERFKVSGYNKIQEEYAYKLYQDWISPDFPRFIVIEIQHANPYYDDSYAVNSANLGPYGDAINDELIPHIEKKFRGLGQGWARFTYGGSTGGWEALATQVFYPTCTMARSSPVPTRSTSTPTRRSTSMTTGTPMRAAASSSRSSCRRFAATWALSMRPSATPITASSPRATTRGPAGSTTSGRRCSRPRAPTATRSPSSTRSRATSTSPSPPTGATTTISPTSSRATGRPWGP